MHNNSNNSYRPERPFDEIAANFMVFFEMANQTILITSFSPNENTNRFNVVQRHSSSSTVRFIS